MKKLAIALLLLAAAAAPALAEAETETIVVTGNRDSLSRRERESLPYVAVIRRADHLINRISVTDDTRDPVLRTKEMRDTLKAVIREAKRSPNISLSVGDTSLRDFTDDMIDGYISGGGYGDVARARIVVKTPISSSDSFDGAADRIKAFVKRVPSFGRSETKTDSAWDLTIVRPEQYHAAVVAKIAADARDSAAKFGSDYGAVVDGVEQPVQWYRAGELNLALYIRYTMAVARKGAGKISIQRRNDD